jgi:hypothetical protein
MTFLLQTPHIARTFLAVTRAERQKLKNIKKSSFSSFGAHVRAISNDRFLADALA